MSAHSVLSVLLLCVSLAAAQSGGGSTTFHVPGNGRDYTIAQVFQFAPIAYYYPIEPFYPVSIQTLTAASALFQLNLSLPNPYVPVLPQGSVTPAVIGQSKYSVVSDDNASGSYFLNISSTAYTGTPLVSPRQVDTSQVPMYFSVQTLTSGSVSNAANANNLVINFYFLYNFNGAQAIRYTILDDSRNAIAQDLANHQGDIETLQVVVDSDMTTVLYVGGSAHGSTNYGTGQALIGQRPVVYVALDSHALYTGADISFNPTNGYNDWTILDAAIDAGAALTIDIIDLYGIGGAVWAPTINSLYHIGVDSQGRPLNTADTWVAFNGRLGFNYQGRADTCEYIQCIGACGPYYTEANAGYQDFACAVVPQDDQSSNGPQSFGGKDTITPTMADVGDLSLPAPGSQLIHSLPVETANGLLVSYTSGNSLQGDVYHPSTMTQGLSAWHGEFNQVCTNTGGCLYDSGQYGSQLGSGNDVSIVYYNSLYVLAYTDRNGNAVGYATSSNPVNGWTDHNWIDTSHFDSFTLPAMAVYNNKIIMVGSYQTQCYTIFGKCLYYQQTHALWWATGTAVSGGVSWSFQGYLGSSWATSADVSLSAYNGQLYVFYRDQSGQAIGTGSYNGNTWTLNGWINTGTFVTQSNAAAAVLGNSLYLAWQDVNSHSYYFATYSGNTWSTPTYINQPVAAGYKNGLNIFLYGTINNLYALYQGGCTGCNGNDYQMVWLSNNNPINPASGNRWSLRALHVGVAGGNQGSLIALQ